MKFELNNLSNLSKEAIAKDIIVVDKILNKEKLTKKDYLQNGKVGSGNTINKYFGSWHNALVFAGLEHKSNYRIPTEKSIQQNGKYLSNNEIINELKKIAGELKTDTLTVEQLNTNSKIISNSTVSNRFGWKQGLKLAGLKIVPHGKKYNEAECFVNLLEVWTKLGKQPRGQDMNDSNISKVGLKAYTLRWGTWKKALTAFVLETNKDSFTAENLSSEPYIESYVPKNEPKKVKEEDKRDIKLSLRFKILASNNFKCVLCGNSPATDPTCKLHVDHIIPFSKGGKTTIENLRTLCKNCNLGRGNRFKI